MADDRALLIFGTGGSGREIASWAERASWDGRGFELLGFIDELDSGRELVGREVLSLAAASERHPAAHVVVAVGDPRLRERLLGRALDAGLASSPPLVHPGVELDTAEVRIGDGAVICPGAIVTVNVEVGAHVQINVHCSVMHDVTLGSFCTLSPGVHVSGNVNLEPYAFMGTGAVTVQGKPGSRLCIGKDAVVGAGAVVTRDVEPGVTVVGVPARPT
jgi:sugar O-acyltransferase (sialic acid O-acetyltransferase NeuD family)